MYMVIKMIKYGIFKERKNRFTAIVSVDGIDQVCHVKNTGRLKELFVEGTVVGLSESKNPNRKTKYDLISVQKGNEWISIDSLAPNRAVLEWLENGVLGKTTLIKPECTYLASDKSEKARFDFYAEFENGKKAYIEVKGVTLKEDGIAYFPDAPTERGIKHLNTLTDAKSQGYDAYSIFVIQMKGVTTFKPNDKTHPEFGKALRNAVEKGVTALAFDCIVTPDSVKIDSPIEIKL